MDGRELDGRRIRVQFAEKPRFFIFIFIFTFIFIFIISLFLLAL